MQKGRFLMPLATMLNFLGSPIFNWQGDMAGSDDVRGYKRIHHRSQKKLRRLQAQNRS